MDLPRFFVFDVESMGLYGEDFAVAFVVVDRSGTELDAGFFNCPHEEAAPAVVLAEYAQPVVAFAGAMDLLEQWGQRSQYDASWVSENVLPHMPVPSHETREQMHTDFWTTWVRWRDRGAMMWADCGYPVEFGFLRSCVYEEPSRIDTAPFPLMEIETLRALSGLGDFSRRMDHVPAHNPLNDVRHSARVLIESLNRMGS